jgi:phosphoserine phosphatase
VLDNRSHSVHYHSGGHGPMLHFHAATGECDWLKATTIPLGFMETVALKPARTIKMEPGDIVGLITDGVFEYENPTGDMFQTEGTEEVIRKHHELPMTELVQELLNAVEAYSEGVAQNDDITIVLVRRVPEAG